MRSYNISSKIIPYSFRSTPFVNKGEIVDRRYLTMNNIGYAWIVINKEPGATNSITVSFFDRSLNSEYHFTDYQKFDLASLNQKSIVLGKVIQEPSSINHTMMWVMTHGRKLCR